MNTSPRPRYQRRSRSLRICPIGIRRMVCHDCGVMYPNVRRYEGPCDVCGGRMELMSRTRWIFTGLDEADQSWRDQERVQLIERCAQPDHGRVIGGLVVVNMADVEPCAGSKAPCRWCRARDAVNVS